MRRHRILESHIEIFLPSDERIIGTAEGNNQRAFVGRLPALVAVGQLEGGGGELGLLALIDVLDHRAQANVGVTGVLACGLEQVVGQVRIDH